MTRPFVERDWGRDYWDSFGTHGVRATDRHLCPESFDGRSLRRRRWISCSLRCSQSSQIPFAAGSAECVSADLLTFAKTAKGRVHGVPARYEFMPRRKPAAEALAALNEVAAERKPAATTSESVAAATISV